MSPVIQDWWREERGRRDESVNGKLHTLAVIHNRKNKASKDDASTVSWIDDHQNIEAKGISVCALNI